MGIPLFLLFPAHHITEAGREARAGRWRPAALPAEESGAICEKPDENHEKKV